MRVHPFIDAEKTAGKSAERACHLLEVSRSAFYARRNSVSARSVADAALTAEIIEIHATSKGTYGAPRVHAELVENGREVGRRKVTRLMAQAGIEGLHKRRFRKTTVADPQAERARDLIKRDFVTGPVTDRRYVGDITYSAQFSVMCSERAQMAHLARREGSDRSRCGEQLHITTRSLCSGRAAGAQGGAHVGGLGLDDRGGPRRIR